MPRVIEGIRGRMPSIKHTQRPVQMGTSPPSQMTGLYGLYGLYTPCSLYNRLRLKTFFRMQSESRIQSIQSIHEPNDTRARDQPNTWSPRAG